MRLLFIFSLLLVVASAVRIQRPKNENLMNVLQRPMFKTASLSASDVEQFMIGFAEGVEIQLGGSVVSCIAKSKATLSDETRGIVYLNNGFKLRTMRDLEEGFKNVGAGIVEVVEAYKACHVGQFVDEIEDVAKKLSSGTDGIVEFIIEEIINVFHHDHDITQDTKDAISSFKEKNYKAGGVAIGKIFQILLKD
eukprot:TRINITY_DN2002_c0_g1_i2.p1 TRINITY_DN2002_c0_g1~~TRINITY_DN2002_c0_g1_i2.p1  ORF type:complete len:194 (+),score=47.88 TRINITY_DN2002_c0_g1_i2:64-645(+)